MPISLDDLNSKINVKLYDPKFFDSRLTGKGGSIGLLNIEANPGRCKPSDDMVRILHDRDCEKYSISNGDAKIYAVPFSVLDWKTLHHMTFIPMPDVSKMVEVFSDDEMSLFLSMSPEILGVAEYSKSANRTVSREIGVMYRINAWARPKNPDGSFVNPDAHKAVKVSQRKDSCKKFIINQKIDSVVHVISTDPLADVEWLCAEFNSQGGSADVNKFINFVNDYDLYSGVCECSEEWQTGVAEILESLFWENATSDSGKNLNPFTRSFMKYCHSEQDIDLVASTLKRLSTYNIPLDIYKNIYNNLRKYFNDNDVRTLCKSNLNLLLSDTLNNLNNNKPNIACIPVSKNVKVASHFSKEQVKAITTREPLVLVQAGAGTGKAQPLDEPVLTPSGWSTMGNLEIGDLVIGSDGKPTEILFINEQGVLRNGYALTFSDGSSTRANAEHLWTLVNESGDTVTVTTQDWLDSAKLKENYHLPMVEPVQFADADLPVPPYFYGTTIPNGMESVGASIDQAYLYASVEQRIALVNGLFDKSGYITEVKENPRYATFSKTVAEQVLELVRSLGVYAKLSTYEDGIQSTQFLVDIYDGFNPFHNSDFADEPVKPFDRDHCRKLVSAVKLEPTPMRCLELAAHDSLYVCKDFIVTHNSTVVLARIKHMIDSGVKPEDIMVLSFTNAAADHISEKNPNVHSMTIASMIHKIYSANFDNHQLSTVETMINSIPIYFPSDALAKQFAHLLFAIKTNTPNSFTDMNSFVEEHYDDVIHYLDVIGQTSLEMEIIICYQKIDSLVEPDDVKNKFLIIDEVQDNSIFEFVYALKYVDKHKESLFMVGRL